MNIEAVVLGIALLLCGYYAGYSIGFKRGLEYLAAMLDDAREENKDDYM